MGGLQCMDLCTILHCTYDAAEPPHQSDVKHVKQVYCLCVMFA